MRRNVLQAGTGVQCRSGCLKKRPDTVGESFELNVTAAQEAGTLIGTAKPIILAQGSVPGKLNFSHLRTS